MPESSYGPVVPTPRADAVLHPVRGHVRLRDGFWAGRVAANNAALHLGRDRLEEAGSLDNLRVAAGRAEGDAQGLIFADSDVYKWLEALAWEYGRGNDEAIRSTIEEITKILAAAQCADGYLDSVVQVRGRARYQELGWSHEHYCAGHLMQAAVAAARTTGRGDLLTVAERLGDHLADTFGRGGRDELDGHPVVEMALVELYRQTGTRHYLELARRFVTTRGYGHATPDGSDPAYFSDRVPVSDAHDVEGHAVRAVYLAGGATDVAIETGDADLLATVRQQFDAMCHHRQYVTGGVGSRWAGEAFGDPYELPTDRAYAETCAAIGVVHWAWRLLLATGEARYADEVEHVLYNAVLPGVSLNGTEYFYVNPLQLRTGAHPGDTRSPARGRRPWFACACCPPNVMRMLASLPAYLATTTSDGMQIHLYTSAGLRAEVGDDELVVDVETEYPAEGRVDLTVRSAPPWPVELALRVPAWADGATLDGRAVPSGRYARIRRTFASGERVTLELPMVVHRLVADERMDAVRGCVAVMRGPLLYAAEQPDQPPGVIVDDIRLDPAAPFTAAHRPDLVGGVTVLRSTGAVVAPPQSSVRSPYRRYGDSLPPPEPAELTLIPYYAWANRGPQPMRVWIPTV